MLSRVTVLLVLTTMMINGCGTPADPNEGTLRKAVGYMRYTLRSNAVRDAVRQQDPAVKPSSVVAYVLSEAGKRNWPQPDSQAEGGRNKKVPSRPNEVSFSADTAPAPMSVTLKADDAGKVVTLNGYGQAVTKPAVTMDVQIQQ